MATQYGFGTALDVTYDDAIPQVKEALKAEGFGVLTEIDVAQTFKEKLGAEMPPFLILGACNPPLAHRALAEEPQMGLLLPCNVVVRREGGRTLVEVVDPEAMLSVSGNPVLDAVAVEAKRRLKRVVAALGPQAR